MNSDAISIDTLSADAEDAEGANIFTVDIGGYEGPLHLLLELARRQRVNLLQLSMLRLAEQYLSFIEDARERRMDIAADYLLMASWLAFMKSRLLLPKAEAPEEDEPTGEEMAARLAFRLKRLDAMRQAVRELLAGPVLGDVVFLNGAPVQPKVVRRTAYSAELFDLISAFGAIRSRRDQERPHRIEAQPVLAIEAARATLRGLGEQLDQWASLDDIRAAMTDLRADIPGRSVTASFFSAALELTRDGEVDMRQDAHFAPIYVRRMALRNREALDATA